MNGQRKVRFLTLKPPSSLRLKLDEAYNRVMDSGRYLMGDEINRLKQEFLEYNCGHRGDEFDCVCLNSGFDAIQVGLRVYGIGKGHQVIVPSNAPVPVWMAVSIVGAYPFPIEPNMETFNVDSWSQIESGVYPETKAIILVHLYGRPVEKTREIVDEANKLGIAVFEDCSQAHGSMYLNNDSNTPADTINLSNVGNIAETSFFSFYPTKNMGAFGDAGILITRSGEIGFKAFDTRLYGQGHVIGINSRMDELQAAFLRVKLKHLEEENEARRKNAYFYLGELSGVDGVILPKGHIGHSWHQFVIRHEDRDWLKSYLEYHGIETMIHYPIPVNKMKVYENDYGELPIVEEMSKTMLSLPVSSHLTQEDLEYVVKMIKEF